MGDEDFKDDCFSFEELPDDGEEDCDVNNYYYYAVADSDSCHSSCHYVTISIGDYSHNYCVHNDYSASIATMAAIYTNVEVSDITDGTGSATSSDFIDSTCEISTDNFVGVEGIDNCPVGCWYLQYFVSGILCDSCMTPYAMAAEFYIDTYMAAGGEIC